MASHLQLERISESPVGPNDAIVFDTILTSGGNISYDTSTGIITLLETGRYKLDWWIATQSSTSVDGAIFSIVSSQGDSIVGNSPIKTGEVVGICIIEVIAAPITVELKNISSAEFYFSSVTPIKAGLTVIGESEGGSVGPTGPTGPQGDIGPTATYIYAQS